MATITSASKNAQISAAYLDNCGWYEDGSVAMAKAFVTVCTAMLSRGITTVSHGDASVSTSPQQLREMIREAKAFVAANDTAGVQRAIHPNFATLRS